MGPNDETTGIPYCICNECIALKKKEMDESLTIAEVVND
jgi:hypothetical protein